MSLLATVISGRVAGQLLVRISGCPSRLHPCCVAMAATVPFLNGAVLPIIISYVLVLFIENGVCLSSIIAWIYSNAWPNIQLLSLHKPGGGRHVAAVNKCVGRQAPFTSAKSRWGRSRRPMCVVRPDVILTVLSYAGISTCQCQSPLLPDSEYACMPLPLQKYG